MLGILIKNNLKLMFRNKFIIILMLLGPILVIAALSSGFKTLMSKYELSDQVKVGYTVKDSSTSAFINQIKNVAADNGIEFISYDTEDYESVLSKESFDAFVIFEQDTYRIYHDKDHKMESNTVSYFLTTAYQNASFAPANLASAQSGNTSDLNYRRVSVDKTPTADSTDYYGIIEIIYFIWCGVMSLGSVLSSERKNHIQTRFNLSVISRFELFLGKAIPCTFTIFIETLISTVLCHFAFGVHWGNLAASASILFLGSIAATCMGIVLFYLFQNIAVFFISVFTISWIFGFVGGSFETYMYSGIPDALKSISPIYFMNRTLVEYSTTGSSRYTIPTILFLIGFSVICGLIGMILMNKRMEEK